MADRVTVEGNVVTQFIGQGLNYKYDYPNSSRCEERGSRPGRSLNRDFERVGRGREDCADIESAIDSAAQQGECLYAEWSIRGRADNQGHVERRVCRSTRGRIYLHVINQVSGNDSCIRGLG